jgi:hypothetical protein
MAGPVFADWTRLRHVCGAAEELAVPRFGPTHVWQKDGSPLKSDDIDAISGFRRARQDNVNEHF